MTTSMAHPSPPVLEQALSRILSAAAGDAALHQRFKTDPVAVLREAGLTVPDGVSVTVEEVAPAHAAQTAARSTDDHLVLPLLPLRDGPLSDEDLEAVAGGGPLEGIWNAITLPFNLASRMMNSNSTAFLGREANALAQGVKDAWNNRGTA